MGIEYNSGYSLLASVSEDAINYIADAVIFDDNSKRIYLRDKEGKPNIKACMHVLGFDPRFQGSGQVVLSEEKEVRHRIPKVLVRHPTKLDEVQECKLYAGKRRADYNPSKQLHKWLKNISFDDDVMHVVTDRESFSIEGFGNDF